KPWKTTPESPLDVATNTNTSKSKRGKKSTKSTKPTKPTKPLPDVEDPNKIKLELVTAMQREHPIRTLDIGALNANASRTLNRHFGHQVVTDYLPRIKSCLQAVVQRGSNIKRACQRRVGEYIERVSSHIIDNTDRELLNLLCPPFSAKDLANETDDAADKDPGEIEELDECDDSKDNKNDSLQFFKSLFNNLHSSKPPSGSKMGPLVSRFLDQTKSLLLKTTSNGTGTTSDDTGAIYPGSAFLRSIAV
ncbi:hypothetical protein BGX29_004343, partial [Mortierella sp. GBA35]